jgi:hypothetical protein
MSGSYCKEVGTECAHALLFSRWVCEPSPSPMCTRSPFLTFLSVLSLTRFLFFANLISVKKNVQRKIILLLRYALSFSIPFSAKSPCYCLYIPWLRKCSASGFLACCKCTVQQYFLKVFFHVSQGLAIKPRVDLNSLCS